MAVINPTLPDLPTPALFSNRLNEALDYRKGTLSELERIQFITLATGRTARTVRAWLLGENLPRRNQDIHTLAAVLGASYMWLHFGLGWSPLLTDFAEKLTKMKPYNLGKFNRYMIRLLNNEPKAIRWQEMNKRGELGLQQILNMA